MNINATPNTKKFTHILPAGKRIRKGSIGNFHGRTSVDLFLTESETAGTFILETDFGQLSLDQQLMSSMFEEGSDVVRPLEEMFIIDRDSFQKMRETPVLVYFGEDGNPKKLFEMDGTPFEPGVEVGLAATSSYKDWHFVIEQNGMVMFGEPVVISGEYEEYVVIRGVVTDELRVISADSEYEIISILDHFAPEEDEEGTFEEKVEIYDVVHESGKSLGVSYLVGRSKFTGFPVVEFVATGRICILDPSYTLKMYEQ